MQASWTDDARTALIDRLHAGDPDGPIPGFEHLRPLQMACLLADAEMIDAALAAGADPETRTAAGLTAARICILKGRPDLAERLIAAGATLAHRVEDEADLRSETVHPAFFLLGDGPTADPQRIARFVRTPEDADARDAEGNSLLNTAILNGRADIAHLLLDRGARPDAADANERTPLHCAAATGLLDVAERLIALGADPNHACGQSAPLRLAANRADLPMLDLLLSKGAHPDAPGGWKDITAAHAAGAEIVRRIESPYDDEDAAGAEAHRRVLARLLEAGASLDIRKAPGEPTLREILSPHFSASELLELTLTPPEAAS